MLFSLLASFRVNLTKICNTAHGTWRYSLNTSSTSFSSNNATANNMASSSANNSEEDNCSIQSNASNSLRPKGHAKSASVSGRSCSSAYASELRPIDSNSTLTDTSATRPRFALLHAAYFTSLHFAPMSLLFCVCWHWPAVILNKLKSMSILMLIECSLFDSSSKNAAISPIQNINRAFPRGTVNRSTFHSGQTRERWPPFVQPLQTQDTSNMNRQSFFSKLSSKFSKR